MICAGSPAGIYLKWFSIISMAAPKTKLRCGKIAAYFAI
jgi:hypothetical protein